MDLRRRPSAAWLLISHLTVASAGCPLPIAHTDTLSPPIVGVVRRGNDKPLAGAHIAVSTVSTDRACSRATLHAVTDSSGAFELPSTEKRHNITWIVPLADQVAPMYNLCIVSDDTVGRTLQRVVPLHPPAIDSIDCLEWVEGDEPRLTCAGTSERRLVRGGHWADAAEAGSYRIIVDRDKAVERAFVQWVVGTTATVIAVRELAVDADINPPWYATIRQRDDASCVTIAPVSSYRWGASKWKGSRFVLGSPGQVRPIDDCGNS